MSSLQGLPDASLASQLRELRARAMHLACTRILHNAIFEPRFWIDVRIRGYLGWLEGLVDGWQCGPASEGRGSSMERSGMGCSS